MKRNLLILMSDRIWAIQRIRELDELIQGLGPNFREAFTQTSETWHDNAVFEGVRDQQTVFAAERHNLKQVINNSLPSIPKQPKNKVGIGATVTVIDKKTDKIHCYFIAGDWTYRAGHKVDGALVVSRKSPIGSILLGKKIGDTANFKTGLQITEILYKG